MLACVRCDNPWRTAAFAEYALWLGRAPAAESHDVRDKEKKPRNAREKEKRNGQTSGRKPRDIREKTGETAQQQGERRGRSGRRRAKRARSPGECRRNVTHVGARHFQAYIRGIIKKGGGETGRREGRNPREKPGATTRAKLVHTCKKSVAPVAGCIIGGELRGKDATPMPRRSRNRGPATGERMAQTPPHRVCREPWDRHRARGERSLQWGRGHATDRGPATGERMVHRPL